MQRSKPLTAGSIRHKAPRVCEKSTGPAGSAGVSPVPGARAADAGTGETPALPGLFTDPVEAPAGLDGILAQEYSCVHH